ncbi:MAG: hypothetical protein WBF53_12950, partial [Litorimonas sp.]
MSRVADMPAPATGAAPALRLVGPMLIWLAVMAVGAVAALFAVGEFETVGKVAVALSLPALLSLLIAPALDRFWAQIVLLTLWTGFAVVASLLGGFFPVAILFVCVPALAMLFTRERVAEAMVLAALALLATFLSIGFVDAGQIPLSEAARGFIGILGTAGALGLLLAAMIAG